MILTVFLFFAIAMIIILLAMKFAYKLEDEDNKLSPEEDCDDYYDFLRRDEYEYKPTKKKKKNELDK